MKRLVLLLWTVCLYPALFAQDMPDMWTKSGGNNAAHPGLKWFTGAKFGLFIHWGLYSKLGGRWKDSSYYGSGEWIMNRAKAPAKEYAAVAKTFNPQGFNAEEWANTAREAGV